MCAPYFRLWGTEQMNVHEPICLYELLSDLCKQGDSCAKNAEIQWKPTKISVEKEAMVILFKALKPNIRDYL